MQTQQSEGRKVREYRPQFWAERETQRVLIWDPLDNPASWMTLEIHEALNQIQPPHVRKKRRTVLLLAEAEACGIPKRRVFEHKLTCAASSWYRGKSGSRPAWEDDPAIANALEVATRRAHWWYDREEAARIALRQRQISKTQDELVDLTLLATETLADLMLNAESEKVRLEAAETIMDRADEATSKKEATSHTVFMGGAQGPTMADIARRKRGRGGTGDVHVVEKALPRPPAALMPGDDDDVVDGEHLFLDEDDGIEFAEIEEEAEEMLV